jgi:hypothetical protein
MGDTVIFIACQIAGLLVLAALLMLVLFLVW